ncbi:YfbK domain-containing protein [Candidatus Uabimicrobium amorphum]|uniref:VWFA domain-containing protein n=1 Tax=Uabimicrobium amorphum TaxID=2596890 RepID=A0A5S9F615_UABAM|nr:von Willebrand factor type A domain-containing protein [Candidatus Uabimicrobium amorphum]BBM85842.1 hypothetical protein UABAM_04220 [Candidatus Uabimicrobium amorphum]
MKKCKINTFGLVMCMLICACTNEVHQQKQPFAKKEQKLTQQVDKLKKQLQQNTTQFAKEKQKLTEQVNQLNKQLQEKNTQFAKEKQKLTEQLVQQQTQKTESRIKELENKIELWRTKSKKFVKLAVKYRKQYQKLKSQYKHQKNNTPRNASVRSNSSLTAEDYSMLRSNSSRSEVNLSPVVQRNVGNQRRGIVNRQREFSKPPYNTERYDFINENKFIHVADDPRSTLSVDVDTASYTNIRRFINQNQMPPKDAVRIEEMINYFNYHYLPPQNDQPFATAIEVGRCLWNEKHRLVRIAIKGKEVKNRPPSNLVFLIDVSGSMSSHKKLPLLVKSLEYLTNNLNQNDKVAIVVYAGAAGLVLPPTMGNNKYEITSALRSLKAGGSTNGGQGIELAYKMAEQNFIDGGINRVVLATDGDFNVGIVHGTLIRYVKEKAKSNIYLSVLGFGRGNYQDSFLEKLTNEANGNYFYIDNFNEAKKVFGKQLAGTLVTIAKDVKIQVEFNPQNVSSYRLIGYENRILSHQDFNNDKKDAGDIGAGHSFTAFYEVVPKNDAQPLVDPLKYQKKKTTSVYTNELMTVKLRYKEPQGTTSKLISKPVENKLEKLSNSFIFASAVTSFGMLLRDSKYKAKMTYDFVLELAESSDIDDQEKREFIQLVKKAKQISR